MRFLFVHQNFPGQYVHVARHLARSGHEVSFITQPRTGEIEGVRKIEYRPAQSVSGSHAYLHELESSVENGLAVARVCHWLDRDGYVPDIVIGHNGWYFLYGRTWTYGNQGYGGGPGAQFGAWAIIWGTIASSVIAIVIAVALASNHFLW